LASPTGRQIERAGIEPLAADSERIAAVREADKQK
jgi:hypothetical protein